MFHHIEKFIILFLLSSSAQASRNDMDKIFKYLQNSARDIATLKEELHRMRIQMTSLINEKCSQAKLMEDLAQVKRQVTSLVDEKGSDVKTFTELVQQQQGAIENIKTLVEHEVCTAYHFSGHIDYCQNVATGVRVITGQYDVPGCENVTEKINVYCDQSPSPGGWLVLLRRVDNTKNFPTRTWQEYRKGFGSLNGSFWLGLELMHQLTLNRPALLRIELEDFDGESRYAEYEDFSISSEDDGYSLHIGNYTGNAGDSLTYHNGMSFSTIDKDQDKYSGHCSEEYKAAWWFKKCKKSQLTGYYYEGYHDHDYEGIAWFGWRGTFYSYKKTEMKIKWN